MNNERMIELAQGQLMAYNQRDIEKFCSFYHPNIRVYRLENKNLICANIRDFKEIYQKRFESNPDLFCELKSRIVLKNSILDEEMVTGAGEASHVVAIYSFFENLISEVHFVK
jgi:hypothetical protein